MQDAIRRVRDAISEYECKWRHPDLPKLEVSEPYDLHRDWRTGYPQGDYAGCYIFVSDDDQIVYVGKASHRHILGRRVDSYFRKTDSPDRGAPIHDWVNPPRYILTVRVHEPFEAPSLEEFLIVRLCPSENKVGRVAVPEPMPIP